MTNPEREQDRSEDLLDNWRKYGYCMFPQQRRIYEQLAQKLEDDESISSVLEAGCGNGIGTAILYQALEERGFIATDKLQRNVDFAKQLYPWIEFMVWDILQPSPVIGWRQSAVVAVEVIEHVADPQTAIKNLIAAATHEVWLSTPNGKDKPLPPENPYHCAEFTAAQVLDMVREVSPTAKVEVLGWEDFKPVNPDTTEVNPLVYRIVLP